MVYNFRISDSKQSEVNFFHNDLGFFSYYLFLYLSHIMEQYSLKFAQVSTLKKVSDIILI